VKNWSWRGFGGEFWARRVFGSFFGVIFLIFSSFWLVRMGDKSVRVTLSLGWRTPLGARAVLVFSTLDYFGFRTLETWSRRLLTLAGSADLQGFASCRRTLKRKRRWNRIWSGQGRFGTASGCKLCRMSAERTPAYEIRFHRRLRFRVRRHEAKPCKSADPARVKRRLDQVSKVLNPK
jgi:hypothetical protein